MRNRNRFRDPEAGRVVGGLILVCVGAALLLRNMHFFLPDWLFTWPMILVLVGIHTGFKHHFHNPAWLIITGIGVYFLVSRFIPEWGLQPFFWPVLIISAGILFIIRPHRFTSHSDTGETSYAVNEIAPGIEEGPLTAEPLDNSDFLKVRSVFSGVNKSIVSKNFQGGFISCVFGGAEIDLRQAEINGRVTIKIEMVFGGGKLVIPPHWSVQNEVEGVFHGIDDKRKFNPSAAINPDKILVLKGSAVFGGLEIKSY